MTGNSIYGASGTRYWSRNFAEFSIYLISPQRTQRAQRKNRIFEDAGGLPPLFLMFFFAPVSSFGVKYFSRSVISNLPHRTSEVSCITSFLRERTRCLR